MTEIKEMESSRGHRIPTQSGRFWGILMSLFAIVMVVTIWKDEWLTREQPNLWFYIFVPILTILGGVLSMYVIVKMWKQTITFLTMFAISVGVNIFMQVVENVMKIIYYRVWEYPDLLYIVLVIPAGFLLMVYGLIQWGQIKPWTAVGLTFFDFAGSMLVGILLTDVMGLTTPGS
jgi:hypothetical protein